VTVYLIGFLFFKGTAGRKLILGSICIAFMVLLESIISIAFSLVFADESECIQKVFFDKPFAVFYASLLNSGIIFIIVNF